MNPDRPLDADDPYAEAAYWAARVAEEPPGYSDQLRFEAWLNADPLNITRMENIVRGWEAVEYHAAAGPVMELRQAALASARQGSRQRTGEWHGFGWRSAVAAACVLLMVIGAGVWMMLQPVDYRTGIGERRIVTLADGSELSMDANTAVSVRYSRSERELTVTQGRAKFDVVKDPLRPFIVRAGSKVVVAVGTSFSVERLPERVQVVLYHGRVALMDATTEDFRPIAIRAPGGRGKVGRLMTPGEEVYLSAKDTPAGQSAIATAALADADRTLSWVNGQLVFNDDPLSEVVERVNRYADRPLRIGDERARTLRVSGVFKAGDTTAIVQGLQAIFHARIVQEPNATAIFGAAGSN